MSLEEAQAGSHDDDRSPQPSSAVDRDRLATLRNDMTELGWTSRRRTPSKAAPPAEDAPALQACILIPESATDRRQWVKQQSRSRRQGRRSSASDAAGLWEGRGRRLSSQAGSEHRSLSRDSSLGGAESDASSAGSCLSAASTPEVLARQRQPQNRFGSSEHAAQTVSSANRSRRSSYGERKRSEAESSPSSAVLPARGAGNPGGSPLRASSSSSSLSLSNSVASWTSATSSSSLLLRWCYVCEAEFTRLRRPHRCRRCLEAVCAPCSPARLRVPGTGSVEPKRTCKRCARDLLRPRVDEAVVPRRRPLVAALAATAAPVAPATLAAPAVAKETAPAVVAATARAPEGRRGAQWRSASVGSMIRAPLGVFSGVAAAVTAGLYTAASGAVDWKERAGEGRIGGCPGSGDGDSGGESSEAARPTSGSDPASNMSGLATGGMAMLGRWDIGHGLSREKPSEEEPGASLPSAEAEVAEVEGVEANAAAAKAPETEVRTETTRAETDAAEPIVGGAKEPPVEARVEDVSTMVEGDASTGALVEAKSGAGGAPLSTAAATDRPVDGTGGGLSGSDTREASPFRTQVPHPRQRHLSDNLPSAGPRAARFVGHTLPATAAAIHKPLGETGGAVFGREIREQAALPTLAPRPRQSRPSNDSPSPSAGRRTIRESRDTRSTKATAASSGKPSERTRRSIAGGMDQEAPQAQAPQTLQRWVSKDLPSAGSRAAGKAGHIPLATAAATSRPLEETGGDVSRGETQQAAFPAQVPQPNQPRVANDVTLASQRTTSEEIDASSATLAATGRPWEGSAGNASGVVPQNAPVPARASQCRRRRESNDATLPSQRTTSGRSHTLVPTAAAADKPLEDNGGKVSGVETRDATFATQPRQPRQRCTPTDGTSASQRTKSKASETPSAMAVACEKQPEESGRTVSGVMTRETPIPAQTVHLPLRSSSGAPSDRRPTTSEASNTPTAAATDQPLEKTREHLMGGVAQEAPVRAGGAQPLQRVGATDTASASQRATSRVDFTPSPTALATNGPPEEICKKVSRRATPRERPAAGRALQPGPRRSSDDVHLVCQGATNEAGYTSPPASATTGPPEENGKNISRDATPEDPVPAGAGQPGQRRDSQKLCSVEKRQTSDASSTTPATAAATDKSMHDAGNTVSGAVIQKACVRTQVPEPHQRCVSSDLPSPGPRTAREMSDHPSTSATAATDKALHEAQGIASGGVIRESSAYSAPAQALQPVRGHAPKSFPSVGQPTTSEGSGTPSPTTAATDNPLEDSRVALSRDGAREVAAPPWVPRPLQQHVSNDWNLTGQRTTNEARHPPEATAAVKRKPSESTRGNAAEGGIQRKVRLEGTGNLGAMAGVSVGQEVEKAAPKNGASDVGAVDHTSSGPAETPTPGVSLLIRSHGAAATAAAAAGEFPTAATETHETAVIPAEQVVIPAPAPANPLRRAFRCIRRLIRLHKRPGPPAPGSGKAGSVAALLPVLKADSPISLGYFTVFGIDAAAWIQTAQSASEACRLVEREVTKRAVCRRARG